LGIFKSVSPEIVERPEILRNRYRVCHKASSFELPALGLEIDKVAKYDYSTGQQESVEKSYLHNLTGVTCIGDTASMYVSIERLCVQFIHTFFLNQLSKF
jgi:hypothetical protein